MDERLSRQLKFILEIDRLKEVLRQSLTLAGRRENSAEHSWHMAVMAVLLAEYSDAPIDVGRVMKMVLVHDIVEVDAGDTYCYDEAAGKDKAQREQRAADRLFGLLPPDQASELRGLWEEFEAGKTADARFANALDRVQPVMLNYHTQGRAWKEHSVTRAAVMKRNAVIERGSAKLWEHILGLIDDSVARGYLKP